MDLSQYLIVNKSYKIEQFGDEILLYAVSKTKGIYLNQTAYLIWQLCEQGHSVNTIIAKLEGAFPEEQQNISKSVIATIESLMDSGALSVAKT